MFKKIAVLAALSIMTVTPTLAGSRPAKMASIDDSLANGTAKNTGKVKKLRVKREKLHKADKHSDNISVLIQAMLLAGITESTY